MIPNPEKGTITFPNLIDSETGKPVEVEGVITPEMQPAHDSGFKLGVALTKMVKSA
jgi:hypothetical protein